MFIILLLAGMLVLIAFFMRVQKIDPAKATLRVPLFVSKEVFIQHFEKQILHDRSLYTGVREQDAFFLRYRPGDKGWHTLITLNGIVLENEVAYQFSREYGYRQDEHYKAKLIEKLRELCAPEPGTAQEAE